MLEGYEVLRKVSEGAAAEVYLARPSNGSDHVIAEVMRQDLVQEPALVARFAAEAKARQNITHPNIAHRVRTGATADGRLWLVSEPVGESLASRLTSRGALPLEVLLPIALQVCEGLEFMHQAGMVHGNLKPATVYVVEHEGQLPRVKLIDFGLSFLRPGRTLPRPPGVILVEPEYLAPERVRGQRCTPLADLYGAGVLLYELLTGFPPFTGADSSVVRRRQVEEAPAPLPESCALLTPIVERCLAKDPTARYPSVGALKTALKALAEKVLSTPIDIELSLEPQPAPPVPPASVVGSYELLQPLGEGAMGRVFLARHQTLDRRVALKILKPELAQSRVEVDRFIQEAQAVNKIRHEHIVEIYDCVDETLPGGERRVYFVMELLQGQSLRERLQNGPLPLPRALRLMRQVALALDAVHRVGVVHRDVKPDNIYLTTKSGADFVKVLDFGVAKLRDQGVETSNGAPVVVGTPRYMAPEQLLGQRTDHRADVYGLGILLYRLVAGQPPFSGTTFEQLCKAIVREVPAPLPPRTARDEPVPAALRALIGSCLEKDPEKRPQTMAEVGTALEGLLAETLPPVPAPAQPQRKPGALPVVAGGLAVALVVAVVALVARTPPPVVVPPPPPPVAAQPAEPRPGEPATASAPVAAPAPERPLVKLVTVTSQPAGARLLRADTGEELGVTPTDVVVPLSGELPVRLTRDGYFPSTARLTAGSASPTVVKMLPRRRVKGGKGVSRDDVMDPFR